MWWGVHHPIKNESYTWKNALQGAFFAMIQLITSA